MKKKFPAHHIRKLFDDNLYMNINSPDWPDRVGNLIFVEAGDWKVEGLGKQYRMSIFKNLDDNKYYMFEEEADVGPDTFITVWENYPNIKEVECYEATPVRKVITEWHIIGI